MAIQPEGGAGVVAGQRVDDDGVHGLAVQAARHGVGQLDLVALAGLLAGEELHLLMFAKKWFEWSPLLEHRGH